MDRLDTKAVRPYVNRGEASTEWETKAGLLRLDLVWQERSGGTFGSGSAAYANYLRRCIKKPIERSAVARIGNPNDRGRTSAWILYFSCPNCSRRCRVLYSKKDKNEFGCVKCNRPAYPSNLWPYTGRKNGSEASRIGRKMTWHKQKAARIAMKAKDGRYQNTQYLLQELKINEGCAMLLGIDMALSIMKRGLPH